MQVALTLFKWLIVLYKVVTLNFISNLGVALALEHLVQKWWFCFWENTREAVHYIMPWLLHTSNKAIKGSVMGRGSHLVVFCKKCVLKNFTKWTGKNPNQKWNSDWGVFLWTFQKNFKACFWTPPGNGFWKGGGFYFTRTQ